jgi:hypothetical protein
MAEHPILFSGEMVRAILAGRKTQTRRVVKSDTQNFAKSQFLFFDNNRASWMGEPGSWLEEYYWTVCPYGVPGDTLWVRETLAMGSAICKSAKVDYAATHTPIAWREGMPQGCCGAATWQWKRDVLPSIHMPRWASRLTLRVTSVRVQRVQDISEEDAIAEGVVVSHYYCDDATDSDDGTHRCDPIGAYRKLWDSLNAARGYGWETNPWVWVVGFTREE